MNFKRFEKCDINNLHSILKSSAKLQANRNDIDRLPENCNETNNKSTEF